MYLKELIQTFALLLNVHDGSVHTFIEILLERLHSSKFIFHLAEGVRAVRTCSDDHQK